MLKTNQTNTSKSKERNFLIPKNDRRKYNVFNPPYDERLDIHMEELKNIGDTLKKNYPGTNLGLSPNLEALKFVGLRPSRKIKLFNASIEARLVKYEMEVKELNFR
jgi:putative N6-adenine-specific DNA methylase